MSGGKVDSGVGVTTDIGNGDWNVVSTTAFVVGLDGVCGEV